MYACCVTEAMKKCLPKIAPRIMSKLQATCIVHPSQAHHLADFESAGYVANQTLFVTDVTKWHAGLHGTDEGERLLSFLGLDAARLKVSSQPRVSAVSGHCIGRHATERRLPATQELQEQLEAADSEERARLEALEELLAVLRAGLQSGDLPEALWQGLSAAVLAVLGPPEAPADGGFEQTAAALQTVASLAMHPSAAHALLEGGALEVLIVRLADRESSAPLRRMVLGALTPFLHHPKGMALFVRVPSSVDAAAPSQPAAGSAAVV